MSTRIKNQESRIKNQIQVFKSNSISSIESNDEGGLKIYDDKGSQKTLNNGTLTPELQKIKSEMEKENKNKLTKEELEAELRRLEDQRKELEKGKNQGQKSTKSKPWGLIIGGSIVGLIGLVGLVMIIKVKKNERK